jgi:hypothetical protein
MGKCNVVFQILSEQAQRKVGAGLEMSPDHQLKFDVGVSNHVP